MGKGSNRAEAKITLCMHFLLSSVYSDSYTDILCFFFFFLITDNLI